MATRPAPETRLLRAGIGLRAPHVREVMATRPRIGWIEVHAENYMGGGAAVRTLEALRGDYPIALHGVGLSLGRADALDERHLARLHRLVLRNAGSDRCRGRVVAAIPHPQRPGRRTVGHRRQHAAAQGHRSAPARGTLDVRPTRPCPSSRDPPRILGGGNRFDSQVWPAKKRFFGRASPEVPQKHHRSSGRFPHICQSDVREDVAPGTGLSALLAPPRSRRASAR